MSHNVIDNTGSDENDTETVYLFPGAQLRGKPIYFPVIGMIWVEEHPPISLTMIHVNMNN
jgi:hypothetical protein